MKKVLFFTTIAAAVFTIQSCCSSKTDQNGEKMKTEERVPQNVSEKAELKAFSIAGVRWKLVEINGKSLTEMKFMTEPFVEFDIEAQRMYGNGGCNGFSGSMELDEKLQRIRIGQVAATQKACLDMSIEAQLMEILSVVDNYSLGENTLSLNKARMAPLARFEAVKK